MGIHTTPYHTIIQSSLHRLLHTTLVTVISNIMGSSFKSSQCCSYPCHTMPCHAMPLYRAVSIGFSISLHNQAFRYLKNKYANAYLRRCERLLNCQKTIRIPKITQKRERETERGSMIIEKR